MYKEIKIIKHEEKVLGYIEEIKIIKH